MRSGAYFTPELFAFLEELAENNDKAWFEANRRRYDAHVKAPMLDFIAAFAPRLREISPRFVADPRPVGGSMFRIHRDTRFSADKSPYKTMASAQFRHEVPRDVHAPGFYLHLEPGQVFMGAGVWHPDADSTRKLREAIASRSTEWVAATRSPAFLETLRLSGDSLKRPPPGFDAGHPMIEDLKRKDFIAVGTYDEDMAVSPDFLDRFTASCAAAAPLMRWLTSGLGLSW